MLPLSVPALMTVVIVQSLWVWNEVLIAVVFLQDQGLRTLMVGLTLFNSRYRHDVPVVMAGMLWAAVPDGGAVPPRPAVLHSRPDGRRRQGMKTEWRKLAGTNSVRN